MCASPTSLPTPETSAQVTGHAAKGTLQPLQEDHPLLELGHTGKSLLQSCTYHEGVTGENPCCKWHPKLAAKVQEWLAYQLEQQLLHRCCHHQVLKGQLHKTHNPIQTVSIISPKHSPLPPFFFPQTLAAALITGPNVSDSHFFPLRFDSSASSLLSELFPLKRLPRASSGVFRTSSSIRVSINSNNLPEQPP